MRIITNSGEIINFLEANGIKASREGKHMFAFEIRSKYAWGLIKRIRRVGKHTLIYKNLKYAP